ncbi:hypothetical protein NMG60_11027251 [Bertholletia excelsa]
MQGRRGVRDSFFDVGDPFAGFGGFGGHRSLMSSFFGGRDPFDDPFFTRPFGSMFESSFFGPTGSSFMNGPPSGFLEDHAHQPNTSRGPIIEELNSDDEKEEEKNEKKENPRKHGRSSSQPYVEDPDDEVEGRRTKQMQCMSDFSRMNNAHSQPQTHSFMFQSSTVSYGGANGTYYTSSRTRRTGGDGLTMEERKEANSATRQASHQISRGIHDRGHTVTRKLNSDGRVNTMQTLHNLNENELSSFEEAWKGNARKHLPGWDEGFNVNEVSGMNGQSGVASRGGWALPSTEQQPRYAGNMRSDVGDRAGPSRAQHPGRMRADVGGDGVGLSAARRRPASAINVDQARRT